MAFLQECSLAKRPHGSAPRADGSSRCERADFLDRDGERALLFEVLAGQGIIVRKSIREWDTGQRVTDSEREVIIEHTTTLLRQLGAAEIQIV